MSVRKMSNKPIYYRAKGIGQGWSVDEALRVEETR
jgi:hypothetical protein